MSTHTTEDTPMPAEDFFDVESRSGWKFFTKFLGWNILVWGGVLLFLAFYFSVWK